MTGMLVDGDYREAIRDARWVSWVLLVGFHDAGGRMVTGNPLVPHCNSGWAWVEEVA